MSEYTREVRKPSPDSVNTGLKPCPTRYLMDKYGPPVNPSRLTNNCQSPTHPYWAKAMALEDVGPFRITGHRFMAKKLKAALDDVKNELPDLWSKLGSAGCLCVRKVRGGSSFSNHSLGLAVDFLIEGQLDDYGDNMVQSGLLAMYPIMHRHGFYWGVEFGKEDGMHFELAAETIWAAEKAGEF